MKIVHLGKGYPGRPGGIESHVEDLARWQAAQGHQVEVICALRGGDQQAASGTRNTDLGFSVRWFAPRLRLGKFHWAPALTRHLKALDADVLHLHEPNPTMGFALAQASRETSETNIPLVITWHSDVVSPGLRLLLPLYRPFRHRLLKRADTIIATSPPYCAASTTLRCFAHKVQMIPLGIALDDFDPRQGDDDGSGTSADPGQAHRQSHGPFWLFLGRLVGYKRVDLLLQAMTLTDGHLVIAGDGPQRAELERLVTRLDLTKRVHFAGLLSSRAQVASWLHACQGLVLPSTTRSEAFGLVQVEAMACGKPVINTAIEGSGVAWVSQDELTGTTVAPGSTEALATAMNALDADQALREKLGAAGRQRARDMFDLPTMGRAIMDCYDKATDR